MSWCVYKHTSPSGKVYIGISSNISIRWSRSGFRYTTYNSINITDGGEGTLGRKVSEKTKGIDMTKAVLAQAKKS